MPTKPSILIVPGSFAPAEIYDPVVEAVTARGHETQAVQLPSVGLKPEPTPTREPPTMYEDAAHIAALAAALADEGKDVVIIGHSYGGVPATESVRGLAKVDRRREGKEGGLVRLAYFTALVPEVGVYAGGVLAGVARNVDKPVEIEMDDIGWLHITDMTLALPLSEMPADEAAAWCSKMSTHSSNSLTDRLTHAGYTDVPVSYLVCENDDVILPESQREMIAMIERVSGEKVDVTSMQTGHCPNITTLSELVDWIVRIAEMEAS